MRQTWANAKLRKMIPDDEYALKIQYGYSELDAFDLGFCNNYLCVAELAPKEFTIVDIGCYQAAQAYYFQDHAAYIGVDNYDSMTNVDYIPPLRFLPKNATHYVMNGQTFFQSDAYKQLDLDHTYFILSAVPSDEVRGLVMENTRHYAIMYPGRQSLFRGVNAFAIRDRHQELEAQENIISAR